ncbi:MAG: hypothetical protein M3457_18260 [Chloroflexota bacterium]|nr:hypothetical protein [Chloroflexota bacterium]
MSRARRALWRQHPRIQPRGQARAGRSRPVPASIARVRAERIANGALRRGVILSPPASFQVDGTLTSGVQLCLNAVSRPDLDRALRAVRRALADEIVPGRLAVV